MLRLMLLIVCMLPCSAAWASRVVEPNDNGKCPARYVLMPQTDTQKVMCHYLDNLVLTFKISIGDTVVWEDEFTPDKCKTKLLPQEFQTHQNPKTRDISLEICSGYYYNHDDRDYTYGIKLWETAQNIELVENGSVAIELPTHVGGYNLIPLSPYEKTYTMSFDKPNHKIPFYNFAPYKPYWFSKSKRPKPKPISTNVYEVYVKFKTPE